jgi:hypothetical protein
VESEAFIPGAIWIPLDQHPITPKTGAMGIQQDAAESASSLARRLGRNEVAGHVITGSSLQRRCG